MRKCQERWVGLYDQLNKSLKQAGDLVNYAEYIGNELNELIEKQKPA